MRSLRADLFSSEHSTIFGPWLAELHPPPPLRMEEAEDRSHSPCCAPKCCAATVAPTSDTSSKTAWLPTGLRYCINSVSVVETGRGSATHRGVGLVMMKSRR